MEQTSANPKISQRKNRCTEWYTTHKRSVDMTNSEMNGLSIWKKKQAPNETRPGVRGVSVLSLLGEVSPASTLHISVANDQWKQISTLYGIALCISHFVSVFFFFCLFLFWGGRGIFIISWMGCMAQWTSDIKVLHVVILILSSHIHNFFSNNYL